MTTTTECEACVGTGRYGFRDDDVCSACHGSGVVEIPNPDAPDETEPQYPDDEPPTNDETPA